MPVPSLSNNQSASSKSGDAGGASDSSFNYNASFQVGGSGTQKQDAGLTASGDNSGGQILVYIAVGVAALALLAAIYSASKKS